MAKSLGLYFYVTAKEESRNDSRDALSVALGMPGGYTDSFEYHGGPRKGHGSHFSGS